MSTREVALVPLDAARHARVRVHDNAVEAFAATQHVMQVRATEVTQAACSYPIFFTRSASSGQWLLSAMTGFVPGESLAVDDGRWVTTYRPTSMLTYPLFLVQTDNDAAPFAVGINEESPVFDEDRGEALFDDRGQPTPWLADRTRLLEADVENDAQTERFIHHLRDLNLTRAININVHHADGQTQTITGLHTIDEDQLAKLSADDLAELQHRGYLIVVHAMLLSIFQLNSLMRLRNARPGEPPLQKVRLEVARDPGAAV